MADEVKTPEEFLAKWLPSSDAVGHWAATPTRLYWCLAYDLPEERLIECAKDLVAVCPGEYNTSVLHAHQLLNWST